MQGTTLRALFEAWKAEQKPAPKTVAEFDKAIRRFEEFHGAVTAASITKAMVRDFKNALMTFPAVLSAAIGHDGAMKHHPLLLAEKRF